MTATLSWLDHSEHERQKYLHVIDMFREQGTVDELGIGTIRDAFADALFPGTSTIQTRAAYFLFIPWMYQELERRKTPSHRIGRTAREFEIRLIDALVDSGERDGVIGIAARRTLKRLPSNVYWNGLLSWGIRLFPGSQPQYHRSMDAFNSSGRRAPMNEDGEQTGETVEVNWHPHLPRPPTEFPKSTSMTLRRRDAFYLRERIKTRHPQTMLAVLVSRPTSSTPCLLPWEHPGVSELPRPVAEQLHHARCFAEVMHGSALLYNLMLARAIPNEELADEYEGRLDNWSNLLRLSQPALEKWDRDQFWKNVQSAGRNLLRDTFINSWIDLALAQGRDVADNLQAWKLIDQREMQMKGSRARLHNDRALALWNGFSGAEMLSYRWPVAQTMLLDIHAGLADHA